MPQALTVEWSNFSEEEHDAYLHTLGNLTLTGYNSELSNKSFQEKKDIIRTYSKATVLNQDVLDKDRWTVENIQNRSKRLAKILLDSCKVDEINDPSIMFEYITNITLDNVDKASNKKLISFSFENRTYPQHMYAQMLIDVIRLLDEKYPGKLQKLADNSFSFRKATHISNNPGDLGTPARIRDNIFVEIHFSSRSILTFIKTLLKEYNVDESQFYISVAAKVGDENNLSDHNNTKTVMPKSFS